MTYREMLEKMDKKVTDGNLYKLGEWIDNQGSRAVNFPDSDPLNFDPQSDWEGEFPVDGWDEFEIASGENEGEKYIVILNEDGKAELLIRGKNAAGEDDWFPPRCDDEKWIGFFELPEGIEWA